MQRSVEYLLRSSDTIDRICVRACLGLAITGRDVDYPKNPPNLVQNGRQGVSVCRMAHNNHQRMVSHRGLQVGGYDEGPRHYALPNDRLDQAMGGYTWCNLSFEFHDFWTREWTPRYMRQSSGPLYIPLFTNAVNIVCLQVRLQHCD